MTSIQREYDYKPTWKNFVVFALLFGLFAAILFVKGNENNPRFERGFIVNRIIELWPWDARIALRVLGAVSIGFAVLAGVLAFKKLRFPRRIVITDSGLLLPRSRWSDDEIVVPFGDIIELSATEVSGRRFLKIDYGTGTFTLVDSLLPRKEDFDEINSVVRRRTMQADAGTPAKLPLWKK